MSSRSLAVSRLPWEGEGREEEGEGREEEGEGREEEGEGREEEGEGREEEGEGREEEGEGREEEGVEIHNVECRRQALPERAAKLTGRTLSLFGMHGSAPMSYPHPHKSWQEQLAAYHIEAVG